jgi:hypothetical protein
MGKYKIVSFLFVLLGLILIAGAAYMIISYPTTSILPFMYIGMPLTMVIISAFMFMGGVYYHRGKTEDEARESEEIERQVVHKLVHRIRKPGPEAPQASQGLSGIPPEEEMAPPDDVPMDDPPQEMPEEVPQPRPARSARPSKPAKSTKKRS